MYWYDNINIDHYHTAFICDLPRIGEIMKLIPKLSMMIEIFNDIIEDVTTKCIPLVLYFDISSDKDKLDHFGEINRKLLKFMKDGTITCPTESNPDEDKQLQKLKDVIDMNLKEINYILTLHWADVYYVMKLQQVLYEFCYLMHEYGKRYMNASDFRVNIMEMFPNRKLWYGIDGFKERLK